MSSYDFTRLTAAALFVVAAIFLTWGALSMRRPANQGLLIAGVWLAVVPAVFALVVLTPL